MPNCNCKTKPDGSIEPIIKNETHGTHKFLMYGVKSIGFLFSLILLPIINIVLIKMMFQAIVLSEKIDIKQVMEYYFKHKRKEEDDEEDEELTDEVEYEMLNVEEISKND